MIKKAAHTVTSSESYNVTKKGGATVVTITVHDDSGAVQETLDIPELDLDDFIDQLPEGWYTEKLED